MNLYRPRLATKSDLCTFHSQEYIDFLSRVTTDNMSSYTRELEKFSVGLANGDTPLFGGKIPIPLSHFTSFATKVLPKLLVVSIRPHPYPICPHPNFSSFSPFIYPCAHFRSISILCYSKL